MGLRPWACIPKHLHSILPPLPIPEIRGEDMPQGFFLPQKKLKSIMIDRLSSRCCAIKGNSKTVKEIASLAGELYSSECDCLSKPDMGEGGQPHRGHHEAVQLTQSLLRTLVNSTGRTDLTARPPALNRIEGR